MSAAVKKLKCKMLSIDLRLLGSLLYNLVPVLLTLFLHTLVLQYVR